MTKRHIAGVFLILLAAAILLFHLKGRWVGPLREWWGRRQISLDGYTSLASFRRDIEAGLNSDNFNIATDNANDSRKGLDENARKDILELMEQQHITFDQARLQYTKSKFSENRIGPDGTPLDPKAVTFDKLRGVNS